MIINKCFLHQKILNTRIDMNIVRTDQEIYEVLDECLNSENTSISIYPGMSYEQGVKAAIEWIIGDTEDHPINDE